jgi:hypothetical protein
VQLDARSGNRQEDQFLLLNRSLGTLYGVSDVPHMRPKKLNMRASAQPGWSVPDSGIGHPIRPAHPATEMSAPGGGMRLLDRRRQALRTRHCSCPIEPAYVDGPRAVARRGPLMARQREFQALTNRCVDDQGPHVEGQLPGALVNSQYRAEGDRHACAGKPSRGRGKTGLATLPTLKLDVWKWSIGFA